jgi:hypothetical protein
MDTLSALPTEAVIPTAMQVTAMPEATAKPLTEEEKAAAAAAAENKAKLINSINKKIPSLTPEILGNLSEPSLKLLDSNSNIPEELDYMKKLFTGSEDDVKHKLSEYIEHFNSNEFKHRNEGETKFLSHEYDKTFRELEMLDSYVALLGIGSSSTITVATAGVGAATAVPVIACICLIARCCTMVWGRMTKYRELSYICSACFSYVTTLMVNVKDMLLFYSIADKDKLKKLNITTGPVWRIVQENLYKFLLFLIGTVDFTLEGLGAAQWLFWNGLLSRVDFSSTPDPTKLFKYSRSYCNKTSYDNKKIDICDNYNDMVMRLLEEKVSLVLEIKLAADSNYLKGARKPESFPADLLKEETFKHYLSLYKFDVLSAPSKLSINLAPSKLSINLNEDSEEDDDESESKSGGRLSRHYRNKTRFSGKKIKRGNKITKRKYYDKKLIRGGGWFPFSETFILIKRVGYNAALDTRNYLTKLHEAYKKSAADQTRVRDATSVIKKTFTDLTKGNYNRLKNATKAMLIPVNQLYREMLREYVIMTGNVSLIMTEYTLHYNKYMLYHMDEYKIDYAEKMKLSQFAKVANNNITVVDVADQGEIPVGVPIAQVVSSSGP